MLNKKIILEIRVFLHALFLYVMIMSTENTAFEYNTVKIYAVGFRLFSCSLEKFETVIH